MKNRPWTGNLHARLPHTPPRRRPTSPGTAPGSAAPASAGRPPPPPMASRPRGRRLMIRGHGQWSRLPGCGPSAPSPMSAGRRASPAARRTDPPAPAAPSYEPAAAQVPRTERPVPDVPDDAPLPAAGPVQPLDDGGLPRRPERPNRTCPSSPAYAMAAPRLRKPDYGSGTRHSGTQHPAPRAGRRRPTVPVHKHKCGSGPRERCPQPGSPLSSAPAGARGNAAGPATAS